MSHPTPEFFRAEHHFHQLAVRARTLAARRTMLRVWCCACGTGEDAYSAAMALREAGCHGEVLATDADSEALAAGRRGMYSLASLGRLGEERLQRHFFVRGADDASRVALVRGELRAMVKFARHDLRAGERPPEDRFDFIFCRDALPGLQEPARRRILDQLASTLAPGGVLFLGQADSAGLSHPELVPCGRTAYERCTPPIADT
jgi:chemotaxis protein methyltransferase CheR